MSSLSSFFYISFSFVAICVVLVLMTWLISLRRLAITKAEDSGGGKIFYQPDDADDFDEEDPDDDLDI